MDEPNKAASHSDVRTKNVGNILSPAKKLSGTIFHVNPKGEAHGSAE